LAEKKFIEITTPKIIGSASEGGADLFSLEYFGKTAYLAQSPQLYKEQMTIGLERVFEISNFYRAENSHTGRHLTEFTSIDIEAAFMDYNDVMDVLEALVIAVYKYTAENCKKEQESIGHTIEIPSAPFERITYNQCVEELKKAGEKIEFGDDLLDSHLRIIGNNHPGFYFLTDWPMKLKPFYIREKDEDATLSRSFDLQYGYLELSSGGTRLHDSELLKARLSEQGLDPAQFEDHLKTFDWGMPPHSGWGMGLDRLMTTLIGIDNVREVVLYPRDPDRLSP
jgi:aspartyl-tRNA synthetase